MQTRSRNYNEVTLPLPSRKKHKNVNCVQKENKIQQIDRVYNNTNSSPIPTPTGTEQEEHIRFNYSVSDEELIEQDIAKEYIRKY